MHQAEWERFPAGAQASLSGSITGMSFILSFCIVCKMLYLLAETITHVCTPMHSMHMCSTCCSNIDSCRERSGTEQFTPKVLQIEILGYHALAWSISLSRRLARQSTQAQLCSGARSSAKGQRRVI